MFLELDISNEKDVENLAQIAQMIKDYVNSVEEKTTLASDLDIKSTTTPIDTRNPFVPNHEYDFEDVE
jgi:hypothetical protein